MRTTLQSGPFKTGWVLCHVFVGHHTRHHLSVIVLWPEISVSLFQYENVTGARSGKHTLVMISN